MSILAYVGAPGSGKSYDVVANQILPALRQDRLVVTNIPLHLEAIREKVQTGEVEEFPIDRVATQPELIDEYAKPGAVIVLDELWRLWPSGVKTDKTHPAFKSFLAEHRHRVDAKGNAMQIVLVTQDLKQVSPFARALVEETFYHTKLTHLGTSKTFRIDVYRGPREGPNPPKSERLREIVGRFDPEVFKCYKSHTMSESASSGANETKLDGRANIWRRPMLYVAALAVVAAFAWGIPTAVSAFNDPSEHARGVSGANATSVPLGPPHGTSRGGLTVPQSVTPVPSNTWRVSGTIVRDGGSVAILTDGMRSVSVPFEAFCRRMVEGWTLCRWEGQEVTEWSAVPVREIYNRPST